MSEWKKHQSINAWTISPRKLLFSAQCEHPAIEATILAFCNQIDEELRNGTVILSNLSDEGMDIDVEVYKISLPPQVDRRKIQAKKDIISGKPIYRYHDTKFSLSKKQIIDLLMGTKLYGKPGVALRELLQNSIDACLLRQKLSELWGIEYTPKVKVSLYTKNNVDYLRVSDNGVGMNQHIIDNYYTNVGCSYYSSREFSELMVSFKSSFTPISRFGIGILSCFMVCDSMEVTTRRIRETSTSISVDEDGEIDTNTSWSERFKSKASLSIHGIEVPYNLFPDYSNGMSKAALKIPFPFSFRLDIGVNSDLNLNSARDQIIYDEKWLTFEENLYRIICRRLKDTLSSSDWKILNEIIQKNNTDTFSRVANSFE